MIPKSGYRFSEKIMLKQTSMIPKSGYRFSEKIMLKPIRA
jgi:DNA-binding winged helix-turn-helix (wHTH) protein